MFSYQKRVYESLAYLASNVDFVFFLSRPDVSSHLQLLIKSQLLKIN